MIDYKALEYYMNNVWQAIYAAKASINELEDFIDSMEDKDCKEEMKVCCAKMDTEINNASSYAVMFNETLCHMSEGENG